MIKCMFKDCKITICEILVLEGTFFARDENYCCRHRDLPKEYNFQNWCERCYDLVPWRMTYIPSYPSYISSASLYYSGTTASNSTYRIIDNITVGDSTL